MPEKEAGLLDATFIQQGLERQGFPVYEADVPYIANMLGMIQEAEAFIESFPHLNFEVPITVFDRGVM